MPSDPVTVNPIPVGADGVALAGIPALPPAAAPPSFPEPGRRTTKALGDLAKVEQRHARWQAVVFAKEAELADTERRAGTDVLAAEDSAADEVAVRIAQQINDLRGDLAVARSTVEASAGKLAEAQRAVLREEAADLRDLLEQRQRTRAEHDGKLRKLLDQVQALDGARYVPHVPPQLNLPAGTVAMEPVTGYAMSRADVLAADVARLELLVRIADAAAAGGPLPTMHQMMPIPAACYSPRVRGPLAYFPAG